MTRRFQDIRVSDAFGSFLIGLLVGASLGAFLAVFTLILAQRL